ncbi:organic hydroperoxide resistance protein [Sphingomonas lycopersici]|uniref:Organic hydroperoxide resistance protein n=1 Tax=Sphingomonas lycopersici TaxID=2951807 RepID=A0AA41Z4L2_9SPHN|nr:organic hydroperoxide resistance protein [Sphingomonas lycopersici]MCW6533947.1 organic hydroperoxide resistance protein [Sphingomonas lycopersici]
MSTSKLYTANVHTVGGREGAARSSDGALDIRLSPPGTSRPGTNPEQLFAAGWSACFEGALGLAAKERGIALPGDTAVDASVDLHFDAAEGYFLTARLEVTIPGIADNIAARLIERAHETCPYSKMTRGGIAAEVTLRTAAVA